MNALRGDRRRRDTATRAAAPGRLVRLVVWLALGGVVTAGASPARGQGVDDQVEEEEAVVDVSAPGVIVWQRIPREVRDADAVFRKRVFGALGDAPQRCRERLEGMARLRIDEVDHVVRLNDSQKQKLELAAGGDRKRFFELVEEKRTQFLTRVRDDPQWSRTGESQFTLLRERFLRGLLDDDSLLEKVLRTTLDASQRRAFDSLNEDRIRLHQQAILERVLKVLDDGAGLRIDQRRRLLRLITTETKPLRNASNTFDLYYVLYQLAVLPPERLRPVFHESQWPQVAQQLETVRQLERVLKAQGLLPIRADAPERWLESLDQEPALGAARLESEPKARAETPTTDGGPRS